MLTVMLVLNILFLAYVVRRMQAINLSGEGGKNG